MCLLSGRAGAHASCIVGQIFTAKSQNAEPKTTQSRAATSDPQAKRVGRGRQCGYRNPGNNRDHKPMCKEDGAPLHKREPRGKQTWSRCQETTEGGKRGRWAGKLLPPAGAEVEVVPEHSKFVTECVKIGLGNESHMKGKKPFDT